jgi:sugar phosphate permease
MTIAAAPSPRAKGPFPNAGRAWTTLALGVLAQTAGTVFVVAPAFLIPYLTTERGFSLGEAGLLAATPNIGMVLALVAWGALADRFGERWVISVGLLLTSLAALGAFLSDTYVGLSLFFLLGGMAAASANAASGRVVVGWFPRDRRGLAMGIRQISQPLGVTLAAVSIPTISVAAGLSTALLVPLSLTVFVGVACALGIRNPPRAAVTPTDAVPLNPYRQSGFLWRIHSLSMMLTVPQFVMSTFGLVWLITEQQWSPLNAGLLVGLSQVIGAAGRISVGLLSDRLNSRIRPLRWVTIGTGLSLLVLAGLDSAHWSAAAVVFVIATTFTVAPNGLSFTAVAEMAGPRWAGRALGIQNTGQFVAAALTAPLMGLLIGAVGYPIAFVAAAVFPAAALPLIPRKDAEHEHFAA